MPFDEIETIEEVDCFTGELLQELQDVMIFPAAHNVTTKEKIDQAVDGIKSELEVREKELLSANELVKAERLRTHGVRHRNAEGNRLLHGDRELCPLPQ